MHKKMGKRDFIKHFLTGLLLFSLIISFGSGCSSNQQTKKEVILSYQTWTESMIVGNIFHILLREKTDIPIKVIPLESSALQWSAMNNAEIDIMPQYTAGGYMAVLGDTGLRDPVKIYDYVKEQFKEKYNIVWLGRSGFYNNYDLAVRPEIAEQYNLKTYSDLAKVSDKLIIVADVNFMDRVDCYPLLKEKYGMNFKDAITVDVVLKYSAIANKQADVINNYTTDAQIAEIGLVQLIDDKHAFPAYDSAPVARAAVLKMYPEIETLLNSLEGKISNAGMTEMNYRVEIKGEEPADVARDFLIKNGLIGK